MNKLPSLLHCCFILSFLCPNEYLYAKQKNTSINDVTNGINSISRAFGDAALVLKKTYDQIDPDATNAQNTITDGNAKTKMLENKLQAVIDSVKQWMTTDSNTKKEALQALQRNTDVISKEVEKAKRQLETANNAANKLSASERSKLNNEIQASAHAVSASSQYYMATKTRLDYETKYKEMIDERNRRLDMVYKINDPKTIRELLSDSTNIPGKKYAEQMGDFTDTDVRMGEKLQQKQDVNQNNITPQNTNSASNIGVANAYNEISNTSQINNKEKQTDSVNNEQRDPNVAQSKLNTINNQNLDQKQSTSGKTPVWHSIDKQFSSQPQNVNNNIQNILTPQTTLAPQMLPITQEQKTSQGLHNVSKTFWNETIQNNSQKQKTPSAFSVNTPITTALQKTNQIEKQQVKYTNSKTVGNLPNNGKVESIKKPPLETNNVSRQSSITKSATNQLVNQSQPKISTNNSMVTQTVIHQQSFMPTVPTNVQKQQSLSKQQRAQNTNQLSTNPNTSKRVPTKKLSKIELARLLAPLGIDKK